jgi:MFS family permease
MGGLAFVAANSVLPVLVNLLGGPAWTISASPMLMMVGFSLLPLFTAHRIERLRRVKPLLVPATTLQRLPFLGAGLGLLLYGTDRPVVCLILVLAAPLLSGLFGGLIQPAWFELVAKTLNPNRRASVFALRNIISSAIGICAGGIITAVLQRYEGEGVVGYGVLHMITFGFLFLSFLVFVQIRETSDTVRDSDHQVTLRENLRGLPPLLCAQRRLWGFIVARMLSAGIFVVVPFMAIHALAVTGRPESFVGHLVTAQMIGAILGNAAAGFLGDRFGGKVCSIIGRSTAVAVCAGVPFVREPWMFTATFGVLGAALFSEKVGANTLGIEIAPFQKRATYIASVAFSNVPAMLGASALSSAIWQLTGNFALLCVVGAALVATALAVLLTIPDPRRAEHGL